MTTFLNTRVLASLAMVVFVAAAWAGATGAFFSDTETSTGNTFTAGELDLKIDNESYATDCTITGLGLCTGDLAFSSTTSWALSDLDGELFFNFTDLKPGDEGEDTISLHVQNDAWACMAMDLTGMPENGVNEAESEGPPADTTSGDQEGELQNYLNFVFWTDDGDNVFELGEANNIVFEGSADDLDGEWQPLADSGTGDPLPAAEDEEAAAFIGKYWCFGTIGQAAVADGEGSPLERGTGFTCDGSGDNNDAQSDGIEVDVEFYAEQARHNDEFLCRDLNQDEPEVVTRLTLEKSVSGGTSEDEDLFTLTASSTNTAGFITGIEGAPAVTSAEIPAGTYDLSESVVEGFSPLNVSCVGAGVSMDDENTVTIAEGSTAVCTFINEVDLD